MPQAVITKLEPFLATEPLARLKARTQSLIKNINVPDNESWSGFHEIPHDDLKIEPIDFARSQAETEAFTKQRRDRINVVLENKPYVFLSGLSGIGKTTFVQHELCEGHDRLFQGEQALQSWADDKKEGRKLLFIDEANLSHREWSEFEGVFNTPPQLLINGTVSTLTPEHKVIFAGNPAGYGDERKVASLFQRHGNALICKPLPAAVLYEKILKPAFKDSGLDDQTIEAVSKQFFDIYRFLCERSQRELLISPRELQMMALMTVTYYKNHLQESPADIATHYAYLLAVHLVPENHQRTFDKNFKPEELANAKEEYKEEAGQEEAFLITPSREPISRQLNDLLALRQFRRDENKNETQQYGGLGGLILEGDPGIGKSQLVIDTLVRNGYEEVHDLNHSENKEKPFYRLPVSMQHSQKVQLLLKAIHKGAVVMIDEINSAPMMERLLNNLLMGKTPEGQRPEKPGFMVIGTQNPTTMAGRRAPSTALARRLQTVVLPPYPRDEMVAIIRKKGIESIRATAMVEAYEQHVRDKKNTDTPYSPSFRNLLRLVDNELKIKNNASSCHHPGLANNKSIQRHGFFPPATNQQSSKTGPDNIDELENKSVP